MSSAIETEKVVCLPLRSPETGRGSTRYKYAGAIDRIEGARLIDWKSCSNMGKFIARKSVDYQPECYAIALRRLGYEITEYEWRVIETPGIELCRTDAKAAEESGRSAAECYEERCYERLVDPSQQRLRSIIHPISEESLRQAEEWLWAVSRRISLARKTGSYLTNQSACEAYNVICPYAKLCKAAKLGDDLASIIDQYFEQKDATHSELGLDGSDIITYSSASTFSLCEQRWYWGTEVGLRPKGEPTSDALFIGGAMHQALEFLDELKLDGALKKLDDWAEENPVIGPKASHKQQQNVARAKAMVRAASKYWEIG